MDKRYLVGIDLGTTNSAVAYIDLGDYAPGSLDIKQFFIPQLVDTGRVADKAVLPSFLYLPGDFEQKGKSLALPWNHEMDYAVGIYARDHGALVPDRLVSSAKSWLCHGGVDRTEPILPWASPKEVEKVSPVEASSRYLLHVKNAWSHVMGCDLAEQEVVLTVPASFDEVARELTLEAAKQAGLQRVTLLEEPLAAFYSWLAHHESSWHEIVAAGDLVLVCDVGGGTTDFSLIVCEPGESVPRLERLAVGDHLLLGGDNIDYRLAKLVERAMGVNLDNARWQSLIHQCRAAKEKMLSEDGPQEVAINLAGRGRSLVGGMITAKLTRSQVMDEVLGRFFPGVGLDDPLVEEEAGEREQGMGLPLVADPAVTRHMAAFIRGQGGGRVPNKILFNGGTLSPRVVRQAIGKLLAQWSGEEPVTLATRSLDLAISLGAAYFGLVRKGLGLSVGGGSARAYYVGVDHDGSKGKAVCIVARGAQEGEQAWLERSFMVRTNSPVKFTLYGSTLREGDGPGDIVEVDRNTMIALPPLQTVIRYGKKKDQGVIPVRLGATLTPVGTLEVYCRSEKTQHRWRLQFDLRKKEAEAKAEFVEGVRVVGDSSGQEEVLSQQDREGLDKASMLISACFSKDAEEPLAPSRLPAALVEALGMSKELWSMPVLRGLCDALMEHQGGKGRSPAHEARWLNLTGYCLRPGQGEASDPWRIKRLWPLSFQGVSFSRDAEVRLQWWIFWRRIAAGLSSGQQAQLFAPVSRVLLPVKKRRRGKKPLKVQASERREMVLFAANLERLGPEDKIALGRVLVEEFSKGKIWKGLLWALARIGARQPLYGPANRVVPPGEVERWLESIQAVGYNQKREIVKAVVSMARLTGDRSRDLNLAARQKVSVWLKSQGASDDVIEPLKKLVPLEREEVNHAFGETLPQGLILKQESD